jgi:predicted acyl esterase
LVAVAALMVPATRVVAQASVIRATGPRDSLYGFRITRGTLAMPDGVRLAVTYWRPVPRHAGESFPVLLEYLPYRKEDSFYQRDYPYYSWFVRRGFIMVKVDIRGTGSSGGRLPPREYSDEEMQDADTIIAELARLPGANGSVGLWGISWGGFNAIQIAMRRPPALKAILAADATDDLYKDDVHLIDGVLHVDAYALQIDHENGLPAPPAYRTDAEYFRDRFDVEPWIFTYLRHGVDGPWWRDKSYRFHPETITIPVFLVGGLLDGYRDAVPRMLESVRAPVHAIIGPWYHAFPDEGVPGPVIEWRPDAVRWFNHWLRGDSTGITEEPRLALFVRDSATPDAGETVAPGAWRYEEWPIARTAWRTWYPSTNHQLTSAAEPTVVGASGAGGVDALRYLAGTGTAIPVWWGDATGNMAADDGTSLVYDSPPLDSAIEMIGLPRVALRVAVDAPIADWTVRLEDVAPNGMVALVTGTLVSGAERTGRLTPTPLPSGEPIDLAAELHFTTWTFRPGHRIRLAVSNSQFPMAWPTPSRMTMRLATGTDGTRLELPTIPAAVHAVVPSWPPMGSHDEAPDATTTSPDDYPGAVVTRDAVAGTTRVAFLTHFAYRIGRRAIDEVERETYETHERDPADSRFAGDEVHVVTLPSGRVVRLHTEIDVHSDSAVFHLSVRRTIGENGRTIRSRVWTDSMPRGIH